MNKNQLLFKMKQNEYENTHNQNNNDDDDFLKVQYKKGNNDNNSQKELLEKEKLNTLKKIQNENTFNIKNYKSNHITVRIHDRI